MIFMHTESNFKFVFYSNVSKKIEKKLDVCQGYTSLWKLQYATDFKYRSSRPKVFCKKGVKKFNKIHREIPVPECLFK